MTVLRLLSIAGSDSGGGAGIQADLKAFAALGAHGTCAVTALTAQNTSGVHGIHVVPADFVRAQIRAVSGDIGVDAAKTGMLATGEVIEAVAGELATLACPIVVDPVMVATSGARLLEPDAERALTQLLLPLATVATPNVQEARVLTGEASLQGADLARAVLALGPHSVVVTGGDTDGVDWYVDATRVEPIGGPRFATAANHGSGCTHSAALATYLARGLEPYAAAARARFFAGEAVRRGLAEIGAGAGPVDPVGISR